MSCPTSLFRFTFRDQVTSDAISHISNYMIVKKVCTDYILARGTDEKSYLAGRAEGVFEIRVESSSISPIRTNSHSIHSESGYVLYDGKC